MEWLWDVNIWSALVTLTVLEIVLGIDNIIFLTLLVAKVPEHQREFARRFGLLAAMGTRVLLLLSVAWLARLVEPWFEVMGHPVSGRDLVLLLGGLWLLQQKVFTWHAPMATLAGCLVPGALHWLQSPASITEPLAQLTSGGLLIGAFFIVTDPVTTPSSTKGKLVYGLMTGFLIYIIRSFGNFPEGVAFAVLLTNAATPLIDNFTRPKAYGYQMKKEGQS